MSNVLIGIIGVILFIGLALAGALILGDDFKTANSAAKAAALMSQLKQAADAATMYRLKTGKGQVPSIETNFLVSRYLRTAAINPTPMTTTAPAAYWYQPQFNNNLYLDGFREPLLAGKYIIGAIGPASEKRSRDICQTIAETYGQTTIEDFTGIVEPAPVADTGCAIIGVGMGPNPGWYAAYQRVAPANQSSGQSSEYSGG
jgi:hypothetical protein